jgi:hypothetical protein
VGPHHSPAVAGSAAVTSCDMPGSGWHHTTCYASCRIRKQHLVLGAAVTQRHAVLTWRLCMQWCSSTQWPRSPLCLPGAEVLSGGGPAQHPDVLRQSLVDDGRVVHLLLLGQIVRAVGTGVGAQLQCNHLAQCADSCVCAAATRVVKRGDVGILGDQLLLPESAKEVALDGILCGGLPCEPMVLPADV